MFWLLRCFSFTIRFELAVQIGDLRVAYDIAVEAEVRCRELNFKEGSKRF